MMRLRGHPTLLTIVMVAGAISVSCAHAGPLHVYIDTSRWMHYPGYLLFTYVTSIPDSIPARGENRVLIRNFVYDGQMGEDDDTGGISGGRHDARDDQPYAWDIDPDAPDGSGRYQYCAILANFAKQYFLDPDALWFGSFIAFDLVLPATAASSAPWPPDALTMTILNADRMVALHTKDPLRGDALIVCSPRKGENEWQTDAYSPAVYRRNSAGATDTIYVQLPDPTSSAGARLTEIHLPPRLRDVRRESGVVWIEYTIAVPANRLRLRVLDADGTECFRRDGTDVPAGTYGDYWPKLGGATPPPGKYRVILEAGDQHVIKDVDL